MLIRVDITIKIFQVNEYAQPTFLGVYDTEEAQLQLNVSALSFKNPGMPISGEWMV